MPLLLLIGGIGLAFFLTKKPLEKIITTPNMSPPSVSSSLVVYPYIPKSRRDFVAHFEAALEGVEYNSLYGNKTTTKNCLQSVAAFESGWAGYEAKGIYVRTNNLYSITKGSSWTGPTLTTKSGMVFRVYKSWTDSIIDFIKLMNRPYYATARQQLLLAHGREFFQTLKKLGYDESDPQYAEHLYSMSKVMDDLA